jgi:hypothetical protein
VQESALPRPGLADDRDHLAGFDPEVEVVKKIEGAACSLIGLAETFDLNDWVLFGTVDLVRTLALRPQLPFPCEGGLFNDSR